MATPTIWTNSAPSDLAKRNLVDERNANDPSFYSTPSSSFTNPTDVNAGNPSFGSSDQFNIASFMQPFPFEQQRSENSQFNQQFTNFLSGLETPTQTQEKLKNKYGYDNLQENYLRTNQMMSDVGNAIQATPENVQQRVERSGTVVNQGQLANIQNKEVADLMKTYTQLGSLNEQQGQRLAVIEQNLNEGAKLELAQQQKMTTPWLQAYDDKQIVQANQLTGWTFANQLELNRLLNNQQAGLSWTNAEAQRANALALQEKQNQAVLDQLKYQNDLYLEGWGA